jgi:CheY-like chemotaxis protein
MTKPDFNSATSQLAEPMRILVIEDNIDDQEMLKRQLQKSGIQDRVMCVEDGGVALSLLRDGTRKLSAVAAVFLDLSLPGINGLLLLQAIRANVETALLPVFIMTGSTNPKDEAECKRLGATSFISKERLSLPSFRTTLAELFHSPEVRAAKSASEG